MKALVLEKANQLIYKDVKEPEKVGERPVLVRIAAAGVCGSDIHRVFHDKAYHYPLILGHEFSAIVEEPPNGSVFSPGDRVVAFPLIPDMRDVMSKIGEYAVSSGYDYFGSRRDGAFSERLYIPEENLIKIPDHIPLLHAAAVEPAAVSLHAILKLNIPANAAGLVIGGGPIGAFAAQWLKILGCSRVFVAEVDKKKLEIMKNLGFEVIDAGVNDTVKAVKEQTNGLGADCTVEASGIPLTLIQAIESAAVFGQVILLGDINGEIKISQSLFTSILRRELTLYGNWNSKIQPFGKSEWDMVISHMDKDLFVAPFISHTPALSEGPKIFADMASRSIWYNKVIFSISEDTKFKNKKN